MIESMYGRSSHAVTETSNIATSQNSPAVIHCTNLAALRDLIKNNKAVAIDFTSQTCGPCRVISPEFDRLIGEANANGTKVVGVSVETPVARDISAEFQIYATPTFMFYHNGEKMSEFKGADRAELKSSIDLLVYTAYPPHPHKKHPFRAINELVMAPAINFVVSSNLDVIFKKLNEIVAENKVGFDTDALETLQNWMKATDYRKNTILPHNWHVVPSKLLLALPVAKLFPLLDILRLLVLNSTIRNYFVEGDKDFVYVQLIIRVLSDDNAGMATKLMLSKFICNLFDPTDHKQSLKLLSTKRVHESSSRDEITRLLVETLLAPEYQLRQASALLAYNIGWSQAQIRQSPAPFDEAWWSELIAAISNAIETESTSEKANDETAFRLIGAIALLLVYSEDPVLELAQVVEVPLHIKHLTSKAHKEHGNWIKKLASEIDDLL
ncbi:hypothetical protein HK103_002094 [Boothiomyces macroporosus]|uniref:Thioredoxin domain-containing protein n=1 Tax=Boothiomyces macroporosus TaxID=261099 RepID=A0AAD5Y6V8_9FUNG|nr:hypothetical protein HK103_002094 [Boothiomyces macroporosus]